MGVFLFSTKQVNTEQIKNVFTTRGHKDIKVNRTGNFTLIYANKVLINNVNYHSITDK